MNIGFNFGALADSLQEQAKAQGFFLKREGFFQEAKHSINLLRINGFLSDSECDKAIKRLMKEITKNLSRLTSGVADGQEAHG